MPDEIEPQTQEPVVETPEQEPPRPLEDVIRDLNRHYETAADATKAELRKHPVVSGIAGDIAHVQTTAMLQADARDRQEKAAEEAREKLRERARDDPKGFAAEFLTQDEQERVRGDQERLRFAERKALAEQLTRANASLPEWGELSPSEQSKIAKSLIGVPDSQLFARHQAAVVDVIADRRASKRIEAELPERLKAEREAWEAEQAATRVKRTPAPNLRSGNAAGNDSGEPDFRTDPVAWNAWYADRHTQFARK